MMKTKNGFAEHKYERPPEEDNDEMFESFNQLWTRMRRSMHQDVPAAQHHIQSTDPTNKEPEPTDIAKLLRQIKKIPDVKADIKEKYAEPNYHDLPWVKTLEALYTAHVNDLDGTEEKGCYIFNWHSAANHLLMFIRFVLEATVQANWAGEFSQMTAPFITPYRDSHPFIYNSAVFTDSICYFVRLKHAKHAQKIFMQAKEQYLKEIKKINALREQFGLEPLDFLEMENLTEDDVITQMTQPDDEISDVPEPSDDSDDSDFVPIKKSKKKHH
jgi:hypothetical protein